MENLPIEELNSFFVFWTEKVSEPKDEELGPWIVQKIEYFSFLLQKIESRK